MQTNQNNNNNNNVMDLEKLKADYGVEMMAYKQAITNYMTVLKKASSPYILIGVGTNGYLYVKHSLSESDTWQLVNDNSNGNVRSVCTGSDGHTIYCTNINNDIAYKTSWDAPTWAYTNSYGKGGKFQAVAACPDGTLLCVGMNNTLYQISSDGSYSSVKSSGEQEIGVAIGLDGSVFVCNSGGNVFKKNSYQSLQTQSWQNENSCCIKAMTISPDGTFIGVGMNDDLYHKDSYTDLTTSWKGPYTSSCCVIGITTVVPNNSMVSIKSNTFWGTGQAGSQSVYTNVTDVSGCAALCATTSGCSGATFNPTAHGQPMCWLRSGDAELGAGLDTDYAIVPESKKYLGIVSSINDKLNNTNEKIMGLINDGQKDYDGLVSKNRHSHEDLIQNYNVLQKERELINKMLAEFDDLEESHVETDLKANQNYYSFILLSVIAVVFCVILFYFYGSSSNTSNTPNTSIIQQGGKSIFSLGLLGIFFSMISIVIIILLIKSRQQS